MPKRLAIVFAETDDNPLGTEKGTGQGFTVFMEGISPEDKKRLESTPQSEWSASEFWALRSWSIIMKIMRETGVAVNEQLPD